MKEFTNYQIWSAVRARPHVGSSNFIRYAAWTIIFFSIATAFAAMLFE